MKYFINVYVINLSMDKTIIETHKEMLTVIPPEQINLINDLNNFIYSVRNYTEENLKSRLLYLRYLYKILDHVPNRPLKNSDPTWMWDCQAIFSNSKNVVDL